MRLKEFFAWLGKKPMKSAFPESPPSKGAALSEEAGRDALAQARAEAERELAYYDNLHGSDRSQAEDTYWDHFRTLPEQVRAFMVYELAKRVPPQGQSGLHMTGGVFWPCGWADTKPVGGVAFAIRRECFAGRDPLLFYAYEREVASGDALDGTDTCDSGWLGKVWQSIEDYSSGIRVEKLRRPVLLFRLDGKKVRKLDILYGGPGSREQPDYVFTWPGAGEFSCTFGEVVDGRLIWTPPRPKDFSGTGWRVISTQIETTMPSVPDSVARRAYHV